MDPENSKTIFDTISYDNGDYYEGQTLDRIPHGEGTMFYSDGETLTCKWIYGEPVKGNRDRKIPGEGTERDRIHSNGHILYVGYAYDNDVIADAFGVSRFIRGIRTHHDNCVLISTETSVYKDGSGWEPDDDGEPIFVYTGEGQDGDQTLSRGNLFLNRSIGKKIYLFVWRRPNEYVFHGQVVVKRTETAREPDRRGIDRMVYKFILARI